EDSSKLFAALLLNDFFTAATARPGTDERYLLFLDEFQQYLTLDLASMLDQVRKGGLSLVMAHQHLGHLEDDPQLRKSIFGNARIKVAFGGLDAEDATIMANEFFLRELNERDVVETFYSRQPDGVEITRLPTRSVTDGWSEGTAITDSTSKSESESSMDSAGSTSGHTWTEYE